MNVMTNNPITWNRSHNIVFVKMLLHPSTFFLYPSIKTKTWPYWQRHAYNCIVKWPHTGKSFQSPTSQRSRPTRSSFLTHITIHTPILGIHISEIKDWALVSVISIVIMHGNQWGFLKTIWCMARLVGAKDHRFSVDGWWLVLSNRAL